MADRIGANYSIGQAILGRWRIRETAGGHGKSGMGIVYIADDLQDHCKVAIKTFQPELVADTRIKRLLLNEANLWLEMGQHENIVSVEHVEVIASQPLIFMEYVAPDPQGRNCLTDHLAHGAQPLELILAWARQICAAMTHMRACGIDVHRDLKPEIPVRVERAGYASAERPSAFVSACRRGHRCPLDAASRKELGKLY